MELQFPKNSCECLRRAVWEVKNEEQTQEIKLDASMPDIGRVLGAWGQPLIRSKEWRGSSMSISGGVMAWVLYTPEESGVPQSVEAWIPFQMRWELPQTERDGAIRVACQLRGVDARSTSARKLMVRAVVSVAGEALEPVQVDLYQPGQLPEDVQVLKNSYPVTVPAEAGEKSFSMDEELSLPPSMPKAERLMRFSLQPELTDKKVMADKVVFRGSALLHALLLCEDERLHSCDFELPFSQYAELEREYDPQSSADVIPAVTNLEVEMQENGTLRLKAGLIGQYMICETRTVEIAADAYSTGRTVELTKQELSLPAVLDRQQTVLKAEAAPEAEDGQIVDLWFAAEHPACHREDTGFHMTFPGTFQWLSYDAQGNLHSGVQRWEGTMDIPAAADTQILSTASVSGKPQGDFGGGNILRSDVLADITAVTQTGIPMISALEVGEAVPPDPARPSMILRALGTDSIWEAAKQCGSTVDLIRAANGLSDPPPGDQILLIPVP